MNELRTGTATLLERAGLDPGDVARVIRAAVEEDLGVRGDLTSLATVSPHTEIAVSYVPRQPGVLAGGPVLLAAYELVLGDRARVEWRADDGAPIAAGEVIATVVGDARGILGIERLSLNLLGHLSGIATVTGTWVDAVAGTGARIRDTRKTTPGLRNLEKYAVRCGGGVNHRRGLDDAVLIKDNHVVAAGGVGAALERVAEAYPAAEYVVQVEVDTLAQLGEALDHGATEILLDNFSAAQLTEAVALVRSRAPHVRLEASGGLRLDNARAVAATGVDYLAVGALTHAAPSLDIGLDSTS
ncbi:MAG TPA: carboxylating nicotinate-nucleotide diphosphorylase [Mycobacteriales bacterium]|nr:carboxylating nicotinate-nucleotide diphosphorylase [Mycobacteriales bacterium]